MRALLVVGGVKNKLTDEHVMMLSDPAMTPLWSIANVGGNQPGTAGLKMATIQRCLTR
jgi:hypothetical protein